MLEQMYRELESGVWACDNPALCLCNGQGWFLSDLDTYHRCPVHGVGVPHPESAMAFDLTAHVKQMCANAYRSYRARAMKSNPRLTEKGFEAQCRKKLGDDPQPRDWARVAQEVATAILTEEEERWNRRFAANAATVQGSRPSRRSNPNAEYSTEAAVERREARRGY